MHVTVNYAEASSCDKTAYDYDDHHQASSLTVNLGDKK